MSERRVPERDVERVSVAHRGGVVVAVPRVWLILLTVLLVGPWLFVGARWGWPVDGSGASAPTPTGAGDATVQRGAWGELQYSPVVISPPIEYVSRVWGEVQPSVWHLPPMTGDELETQLLSFGIGRDDAARLRATARSADPVPGLFVAPDRELVGRLSPEVRGRAYLALGRYALSGYTDAPINYDQVTSYRFFGESIDDWLEPIAPETRRLVEPYVYQRDGFLYFADIEQVRSQISDPDELQRLAKRLLRHSTVLARLRVPDAASVDAIAEYWGRGGRRTDLRPLLESVGRVGSDPALGWIDISHLLPPLAREHLYRYPRPSVADLERPLLANCLWTALNFFNAQPDDRYLDPATAMESLKNDYYLVQDNFQLGDIVAFTDSRGVLVHVAVHVAGDLLFSKNGTSALAPWSMLPLDRFKGDYVEYSEGWQTTYHRRKDL